MTYQQPLPRVLDVKSVRPAVLQGVKSEAARVGPGSRPGMPHAVRDMRGQNPLLFDKSIPPRVFAFSHICSSASSQIKNGDATQINEGH